MNEGKFKKRIKQEQVGIGISDRGVVYCSQLERWIDEAKKEFPIKFRMIEICDGDTKMIYPKNLPLSKYKANAYLVDQEVIDWFLKWFGDTK